MTTYNILYERLVLNVWGITEPWTDPFMLGSRVVFDEAPDDIGGDAGHHLKFGLSAALRRAAVVFEDKFEAILELDNRLWEAKKIYEVCSILDEAATLLDEVYSSEMS